MKPLFVYGTLRQSFSNRAARRLHASGEYLGTAVVRGSLFDCGRYPGMMAGDGRVRGELYRVGPQLLRYLDAYEAPDFRRSLVVTCSPRLRAFAYLLRRPPS